MPITARRLSTRWLLLPILLLVFGLSAACDRDDPSGNAAAPVVPLYLAVGASDAVGTGARDPGVDGWVVQLHRRMPGGTRLANLAIGGLTMRQAVEQVLPVAVDLRPSVVTVWLAANDVASGVPLESYLADLDTLLATLAGETEARVYVANLPDLTLLPAFRARPPVELRAEVLRWNEAIAAVAHRNGAELVDIYGGWTELRDRRDYISRDGLHPSTTGHRRLAELFWQTIAASPPRPALAPGD